MDSLQMDHAHPHAPGIPHSLVLNTTDHRRLLLLCIDPALCIRVFVYPYLCPARLRRKDHHIK